MKHFPWKNLVLLIAATLMLTASVGGTLAYFTAETPPVVNTFTTGKIDTELIERKDRGGIPSVVVGNRVESLPVYVRVALVGNWVDGESGEIVVPWSDANVQPGPGWIRHGGYYYYTQPLDAGQTTSNLLAGGMEITPPPGLTNAHLEMTALHQAIQAYPADAALDAWKVDTAAMNEEAAR